MNSIVIDRSKDGELVEKIISLLKTELPEENQTYAIISEILDMAKCEISSFRRINL